MIAAFLMLPASGAVCLPMWEFEAGKDAAAWVPNGDLADVRIEYGTLCATAADADPFFLCRGIELEATPWQYVLLRIKASRPGVAELFWTGELEGKYGGLTQEKKTRFSIPADGWQEIAVFPFWHTEGVIRQLRLDLYDDADFTIDWIRVAAWGGGTPQTDTFRWELDEDASAWRVCPGAPEFLAPPCRLSVADKDWITVQLRSDAPGVASVLWACEDERGVQSEDFTIRGDGESHTYDVLLAGIPSWRDSIVAFGLRLPPGAGVRLESVAIAAEPSGPADLDVSYFGFEDGVNRAGRPEHVLVQLTNRGGKPGGLRGVHLRLPEGLRLLQPPEKISLDSLTHGEVAAFIWEVQADQAGYYEASLDFSGKGAPAPMKATLHFLDAAPVPAATYVPEPHAVRTAVDVCAYYFPGWDSSAKWDCIRRVAPVRKPLLGYYDEADTACVDWQIKWAVENGISCFLVDWYWTRGAQHLTHWFEAYRQARYRDQLDVAIMWANHNPPGTHSAEDWRNVTKEWIDHYFNLDTYYKIDGRPAVFIWNPRNVRNDVGGSEAVQTLLEESQAAAREAGHEGITFVAMGYDMSPANVRMLHAEGYAGLTTYHEWGRAQDMTQASKRARYEDVARTSPAAWEAHREAAAPVTYFPLVDTGWDDRPWHGNKGLVIEGRTPALFEGLLHDAKAYCEEHSLPLVVLGPLNEWGEGSYIEPCTEFGFEMYEAIRQVFASEPPAAWPMNLGPRDMDLGPYDFPKRESITLWNFEDGAGGWRAMMNVADVRCEGGALRLRTVSRDPALVVDAGGVDAKAVTSLEVNMRLNGDVTECSAQMFWASGGAAISEATSVRFPVKANGELHTYHVPLSGNARWRGRISTLRFDPCDAEDVAVVIERVELLP